MTSPSRPALTEEQVEALIEAAQAAVDAWFWGHDIKVVMCALGTALAAARPPRAPVPMGEGE